MAEDSDEGQTGNGWREQAQPKIVIIGAGISGITAGNYLASAGFTDFVILEATNRTGGRIATIDLGECYFSHSIIMSDGPNFSHRTAAVCLLNLTHSLNQLFWCFLSV